MCSLCGTLYSTRHWAEAPGAGTEADARRAWMRDRLRRVELLNRVLRPLALSVAEWEGTAYVLSTRTGESVLCADLATLFTRGRASRPAPDRPARRRPARALAHVTKTPITLITGFLG